MERIKMIIGKVQFRRGHNSIEVKYLTDVGVPRGLAQLPKYIWLMAKLSIL
jgi:hypothetical protein